MLGIREPVRALDYSAFENAEIVHDLNAPVAETLHGCFDLVLDSGTLEHVFDVRQSLANVARLLRPGGRVIHISPANNFANHGLYQFSPTLFFDYYAANGFSGLNGIVFEYDPYQPTARHVWHLFQATPQLGPMTSRGALAVLFVAEKTAASTADRVPLQSFYRDLYAGNAPSLDGRGAGIKQLIPFWLKLLIKKHVPRATPVRRPWGLKALGRVQ
jgi:SAM-dependent methyltransferase